MASLCNVTGLLVAFIQNSLPRAEISGGFLLAGLVWIQSRTIIDNLTRHDKVEKV